MYGGNGTRILQALGSEVHLEVEPFHGKLPRWRLLFFKTVLVAVALVLVVLPTLAVLWLLFAGVYRATRGHDDAEEALSQARVAEVHRLLAKKNS